MSIVIALYQGKAICPSRLFVKLCFSEKLSSMLVVMIVRVVLFKQNDG